MSSQEYVSMRVEGQECQACGASISFGDGRVITCEFCDTENRLLQPLKLKKSSSVDLKGDKLDSFSNMLKICETSMTAGSFKEAYEYCNKLLELDPENGEIYANKAICSLNLSTVGNIWEGAKDISTFIKTALRYSPDSETVKDTAENIAYNLYYFSAYKAGIYVVEKLSNIYVAADLKKLLLYIKVWDTAFDIHNDTDFLKNAVTIISGHELKEPVEIGAYQWAKEDFEKIIRSSRLRDNYIKKIQKIEADYTPPSLKKGGSQIWAIIGTIFFIIIIAALFGI